MTTAPLLPAEAALLIEPSVSNAGKCLQAALLTLLGRDHIMLSESRSWFVTRRTLRLMPGDGQPLPPHLAVLKNTLATERGSLLRSNEVARALQKWFGNDFRRYVHDHLARELIDRGLLVREEPRWLGLIPYIRYRRTTSGEARVAPLLRLMDEAGNIKKLIRTDPDRAVRLARAAGVLLVLSPAAHRQLPKLKALVEQQGSGDSGSFFYTGSGDDEPSSHWEIGVDFGDFSFATDAVGMFDGIAGVGDFTGGDGGGGGDGDGGGGGD